VESHLYHSLGQRLVWDRTKDKDTEENQAIQYLFRQIGPPLKFDLHRGPARILRFRKCRECVAWFYAVTDPQIYCSESCRKRNASHSPEFKKKRAEYMKQYRIDQAKLDAQAMRLVKEKCK
jgi:hypothetical protein